MLHSTAENAQEKNTATENDRHPRKTKSEPGTPTFSVAFSPLALSQLSRPCQFWLAFTTTPTATRELPPSPKKLQTDCGGGTHAARRSLRTPFPRHTYTLLFSPPRGTTELDLGGRRSRLDVNEDGDASICSLPTHDEPMLTCNPCSLATHEGAQEPMPMRRAIPRSAHFCP